MLRPVTLSIVGWGAALMCSLGSLLVCHGADDAGISLKGQPSAKLLTQSRQEAFEWFDGLGFPTLKDRRVVRVATGWSYRSGNDAPQNQYRIGFLIDTGSDRFTIFSLDLDTRTFTRTPTETPEHQRVGYKKLDLKEQAVAYLASLRALREGSKSDPLVRFHTVWHLGGCLSMETEAFVLARACAAAGLEAQAKELLDFVAESCSPEMRDDRQHWLRERLSRSIGHREMWKSVLAFGDPKISQKELLKQFERLVRQFPESKHVNRARETADLLRQMVREDEEHAKQAKPNEESTVEERVAELVFRLRDQNGQQWSQPGRCDVFLDPRREESPAHQLVKLGFDAAPQLIEAIGDRRFTRSVGYHRNFYFSHYVLRVGDCARAVLERIAGRQFYDRRSTSGEMSKDDATAAARRQIREWWEQVQEKGEKQVLVEAVELADNNSPWQAERLLEKHPDVALAAIIRGARRTENVWARERLVNLAARIEGDAPMPFLLEEMKQGSRLSCRVAAAHGLLAREHSEALPAMIGEWKKGFSREKVGRGDDDGAESLIGLLAGSGSPEAVRALAEGLDSCPVDVKLSVVSAFGPRGNMSVVATETGGSLKPAEAHVDQDSLRTAVEELLVGALDDTERRMGMSATWGQKSFGDPRICDVAGHVLWMRWPEKYAFDIEAPATIRDRQRVELKNVWRKERGLPPLELPEPPRIPRLSEEELRPLWDAILQAANEAKRKQAVAKVEARGLSALPAARKLLAAVSADAPSRSALEAWSPGFRSWFAKLSSKERRCRMLTRSPNRSRPRKASNWGPSSSWSGSLPSHSNRRSSFPG